MAKNRISLKAVLIMTLLAFGVLLEHRGDGSSVKQLSNPLRNERRHCRYLIWPLAPSPWRLQHQREITVVIRWLSANGGWSANSGMAPNGSSCLSWRSGVVCVKFSKKILGMWAQVKPWARSGALGESSAERPAAG